MSALDFDKKGVPVTLLGLNNAGKTSLAMRLVKGEWFEDSVPTIGINFEMYRAKGSLLKIFDVGGHEVFRRNFWLNYASNSYGILFVFDASDRERTKEGKEWFWYLIDNLIVEGRIAIAFLANKADLNCMTLDEIVDVLELHKMSSFPKISFQIFKTSVKTGQNIDAAMAWFTKKIQEMTKERYVNPKGFIISNTLGKIQLFLDFADIKSNTAKVMEMLSQVVNDEEEQLSKERVASIASKYAKIVFQERGEVILSLICEPDDSQVEAQRMIELIFDYIEEKKARNKSDLMRFITETLDIPQDEYREIVELKVEKPEN